MDKDLNLSGKAFIIIFELNFHIYQSGLMNLKVLKSSSYLLRFCRKFCYGLIYREHNR